MAHQPKALENRAGLSELHQGHRPGPQKNLLEKNVLGRQGRGSRAHDLATMLVALVASLVATTTSQVKVQTALRIPRPLKDHRDCVPAMWS
jgi:hypothetical protein